MHPLLQRLRDSVKGRAPIRKPEVDLFLGNDREIGRSERSQEKRVGITPDQVRDLRDFLSGLGVRLHVFVLQGAGQRAGYPDSAYAEVGAEIVAENEVEHHDRPPDVVHALKEPSSWESRLPGPFCRIGALHSGNFGEGSGLARLLLTGDVAIFDGSHVGAPEAYRIPIRGRMSEFAGEIAAEWVAEHVRERKVQGHVVVVGGGRAGLRAAELVAREPYVLAVRLFEVQARCEAVRALVRGLPESGRPVTGEQADKIDVCALEGRDDPRLLAALDDPCVGVVFAVARPGERAPKVVHVSQLERRLPKGAVLVDISIDERGAIFDPGVSSRWVAEDIIAHLKRKLGAAGLVYRAQENMPRSRAREASAAHGEAVLPYLATLLYLAAVEAGPAGVRARLRRLEPRSEGADPRDARKVPDEVLLAALEQDLRNGLAFHTRGGGAEPRRLIVDDVVADRTNVLAFLLEHKRPFECRMPTRAAALERARQEQALEALQVLPKGIRRSLEAAYHHDVPCTLVAHPGLDGTSTEDAARALGSDRRHVLKALVFQRQDESLFVALCAGDRHVDDARLSALCGASAIELADETRVIAHTDHAPGALPVLRLSELLPGQVYVSAEVFELDHVFGSAGSEFFGLKFAPQALRVLAGPGQLEGRVAPFTLPRSRLLEYESHVRERLAQLEKALHRDEPERAERALRALQHLLHVETPAEPRKAR